jgi:hypothetical protein
MLRSSALTVLQAAGSPVLRQPGSRGCGQSVRNRNVDRCVEAILNGAQAACCVVVPSSTKCALSWLTRCSPHCLPQVSDALTRRAGWTSSSCHPANPRRFTSVRLPTSGVLQLRHGCRCSSAALRSSGRWRHGRCGPVRWCVRAMRSRLGARSAARQLTAHLRQCARHSASAFAAARSRARAVVARRGSEPAPAGVPVKAGTMRPGARSPRPICASAPRGR